MRALLSILLVSFVWAGQVQAQFTPDDVGSEVEVELHNGDVLTGTLTELTGTNLVLLHPNLGAMTIPRVMVRVRVEEEEVPEEVEPVAPWKGKFSIGASGSRGNSINDTVLGVLNLQHKTEEAVETYEATYQYTSTVNRDWNAAGTQYGPQRKERTANRFFAKGRREWIPEDTKWRPFLQGTYEEDSLAGYSRRLGVHTGLSYPIIDEDIEYLSGRFGVGVTEDVNLEVIGQAGNTHREDVTTYDAIVGANYRLDVDGDEQLTFTTDIYPSLNDTGEFRSESRASYGIKLGDEEEKSPWEVALNLEHRYDTTPGRGDPSPTGAANAKRKQRTDYVYYISLGRTF